MPLQKLQFQPGIVRESTEYARSGGWYDADKVRFRMGYPEKIGGWQRVVSQALEGVCRHIHQWADLESDRFIALGTSSHLYILWSQAFYDITPLRSQNPVIACAANPFQTSQLGTTEMIATVPNHQARVGDYVIFSGATTNVNVYTPAMLNQEFQITAVDNVSVFRFNMPTANTAAGVAGGGTTVQATFLIPSGQADAVIGQGWGIPPWGGSSNTDPTILVGWGQAFDASKLAPLDPTAVQLRLWDQDNFGEDLVANIRNGTIYYWHRKTGLNARAVPLNQTITVGSITYTPNQVPEVAAQVIVSPNDRHVIAMGCDDPANAGVQDPLLVRWSTEEDAYTWQPLRTNSAGSQRLSAGSYIIAGMRTRSEILIWTDLGLWSMKYIGTPYVFGFDSIAEGLSIIGPNAMINTGNILAWMDRGIFYAYTGQVQELPCTLKDYVFSDFNYLQGYKVYAGHNHAFSEIIWFYPSSDSIENDSYVIYNYVDQLWSKGTIERTAWLDMGRGLYPVATDRTQSLLYYHEYGDDADQVPLAAYIDSADMDIDGGEHFLFMSRFIPDVFFRGTADQQSVGVTIYGRSAPGKPKATLAQLTVTPWTPEQYIRVRERQISFRIESDALGVGWRLGTLRADMQPDGRR